jgi:hypothetical protein
MRLVVAFFFAIFFFAAFFFAAIARALCRWLSARSSLPFTLRAASVLILSQRDERPAVDRRGGVRNNARLYNYLLIFRSSTLDEGSSVWVPK